MTGDPRDEPTTDDLEQELRAEGLPDFEPGAVRRIADGAWRRDAVRREAGRAPLFVNAGWRRMARLGVAASLVAAAGVGMLALQGTEPAFAVDGDPVQVWDGAAWEPTQSVDVGSFIFVPEGVRTLHGRDGSRIDPLPGACFRLAADLGEVSFRVEVLRGRAEVLGRAISLNAADVRVEPEKPRGMLNVTVEFTTDGGSMSPPADPVTVTWSGTPSIHAVSNVRIWHGSTGQSLVLQPAQAATLVAVTDAEPPRLAYLQAWSSAVPEQISSGNFVINTDLANDRVVLWENPGFTCVSLPRAELKLAALAKMNDASSVYLPFLTDLRDQRLEVQQSIVALRQLVEPAPTRRELRLDRNGESIVVRILSTGEVTLQRGSEAPQRFDDVEALRKAEPDAASLFGKQLD